MSKYTLPDWSHMYVDDAKTYTKDMVNKMIEDGYLTRYSKDKNKTNSNKNQQ